MLEKCKTAEEMTSLSKKGQDIFRDVENCEKPVVAAIMGSCLGGGLEVGYFDLTLISIRETLKQVYFATLGQ